MGCRQSTLQMQLGILALRFPRLALARRELAALWPQWLEGWDADLPAGQDGGSAQQLAISVGELIVAVQLEAGIALDRRVSVQPVTSVQGSGPVQFELFLPSHAVQADLIAIRWAIDTLAALLHGDPLEQLSASVAEVRQALKPFAEQGVNNFPILRAAYALGIPVFRPQSLLVLGMGQHSRWLQSLMSDLTPGLSMQVAQNKLVTASLLHSVGLPGAVHRLVRDREQALEAAAALGYPVVVKPADADRGEGVAADLRDPEAVVLAFDVAHKVSPMVLVERWVPGNTHRLTVQDGEVLRVVKRTAGGVVGDGVHSVARLVELYQQTPRQQRMAHRLGHAPLALDEEALVLLQREGLTPEHCPAEGQYVRLRRRDNVNAGGSNQELSPDDPTVVHPDNRRLAIETARLLRLDFAGIDLITTDISRSWLESGALICEVNARPQMGASHDTGVYQRLLARMFPHGFRIPAELVVVPSDEGLQAAVRDRLLSTRPDVSVSSVQGLWIEGIRVTRPWANSFEAALGLLQRREVGRVICLMTPADIHRFGLPMSGWDRVLVAERQAFTPQEQGLMQSVRHWLAAAVLTP